MKYLAMLFLLGLLSACATVGNESLNHRSDDWPPMDMTRAQLLAELGPPTTRFSSMINGESTEILGWGTNDTKINPWFFVPIVDIFIAASGDVVSVSSRTLVVTFTGGKLISRGWNRMQIGGNQISIEDTTTTDTR